MQRLVAPVGHVVEVDDDASHRGLVEQVDQARLHPAPAAVVVLDAQLGAELTAGVLDHLEQDVTRDVEVLDGSFDVVRLDTGRCPRIALDRGLTR